MDCTASQDYFSHFQLNQLYKFVAKMCDPLENHMITCKYKISKTFKQMLTYEETDRQTDIGQKIYTPPHTSFAGGIIMALLI